MSILIKVRDKKALREQRKASIYGMLGEKGRTLKEACERAGLPYGSIKAQLSSGEIGLDRLSLLEQAVIELPSGRKLQPSIN